MKKEYSKSRILALVLTIAALAVGQTVRADQTWSVSYEKYSVENNRYAAFTITRTETIEEETVLYRTVSLKALAGKYFEEKTGELTFDIGQASKTVIVHEQDPGDADLIYNYWTYDVQYRSYRFEVLDNTNGAELAHCDRPITHGSQYNVDATKLFQNKEITAFTTEEKVDDAATGFGQASYVINPKDEGYYASADAPKAYLTKTGMKLAMTFDFLAKEKEDGYQYFQVLVDDETNYDSGNGNGDVGEINYAHFLAGFGHDPGKKNTHYAKYAFPVPDAANIALGDYDDIWLSYGNTVGRLYSQKTKSDCWHEATGRLLADPSLQKIIVRFDASGKNDDTWYVKDLNVHIQAIDEQKPTIIADDVRLSPGPYVEGSTFYVSVPFSEIVVVPTNAKPTITTNWGNLTYDMGSGTNVLVFKGTIGSGLNPTAQLQITGLSGGPVRDLWGNPFVGDNAIGVTFPAQTIPSGWTGTGTEDDPYLTAHNDGLYILAQMVNSGIDFGPDVTHPDGYFFKLYGNIQYNGSTTNNYTAIGSPDHPFRGHFDGGGFTVSNIKILTDPGYQGLFGYVGAGGSVKNVTLTNSDIKVIQNTSDYAAGIVGCCVGGSVSGCLVYNTTVKCKGSHVGPVVGNDDAFQEHNYYRHCELESGIMTNVFSIKVDEGVTVSSPVKTYSGTGYFLENAHVRLFAPIGKAFASITVTRNSYQSDVTDDVLSGTTIIMPAYDITVSSPLDDVWDVAHGADGSEDKPYIISTAAGWDALAAAVNRGEHYYEKFFKLSDDFDNSATPVTTMAGWGHVFFSGTFLGNGRTLTVNLENRNLEEEVCAPFVRTFGATIKNLRVAGTITTDNKMAAGIVSHMKRTTLEGCVSSVTIISSVSGDGTHGGVVGVIESGAGNSGVRGCVFDGVICCTAANLTHSCGGIAGWKEVGTNWLDCLYAPAAIPEGKYALDMTNCSTFARIESGSFYANSYYTESLGDVQKSSWRVYPFDTCPANVNPAVVNDYAFTKTYNNHCIEYGGKFYVHPETCTLNESGNYSTDVTNGYFANITLDGRTLHKDGAWNTLCLPFDVTAAQIAASDLAGADIRTLSSASFENSTLTLNFTAQGAVTSIQAGVPYIVKWASGTDVVSPTIDAVIIDNTAHNVTCDLGDGKSIVFKGTKSATTFTEDDNTKLFVGTGNKLHYPLTGASINAQRAYFQLNGLTAGNASSGAPNLNIVLNFGDGTTSLNEELRMKFATPHSQGKNEEFAPAAGWFTINGVKLSEQPTQKGVYIHNGRKIVIK